jgi:anti-sigma B factor antagonist
MRQPVLAATRRKELNECLASGSRRFAGRVEKRMDENLLRRDSWTAIVATGRVSGHPPGIGSKERETMQGFAAPLTIEERTRGYRCVVRLSGELDMAGADRLEALLRSRARSHREIVVDLDALTFLDSFGIRAILTGHDACAARGHRLLATGAPPRVRRVLETCGLLQAPPFLTGMHRPHLAHPLSTVKGATRSRPRRRRAATQRPPSPPVDQRQSR